MVAVYEAIFNDLDLDYLVFWIILLQTQKWSDRTIFGLTGLPADDKKFRGLGL